MPRTPKQIAEYIDYYKDKPKEEREWAFRNLAESEGKSINQLIGIANGHKNGSKSTKPQFCKNNPIPDELREQVREAVRAGMSNVDIMAKYGLSHNTVTRIKCKMRDEGETLPETRGKKSGQKPAAEKQPEAYPNQINDEDEPEPIVEGDVKTYIPHECDFAGECKTEPEKPAEKKSLGECLSDLGDAFCKLFGVQPTEIDTDVPEAVDYVAVLVDLMTFVREKFGEGITIDKISCGRQESKSEIGFYKGDQLYYIGLYAMAKGEEE